MKIMDYKRRIHTQGRDDGDYQIYKTLEPDGGPWYYGFMNVDGGFIIMRGVFEEVNSSETVWTFYYGKGGTVSFETAWTAKVGLNYVPILSLLSP